ncbi:hypoxia up-regulated protein 1-like [Glandiceps talaboti]
MSKLSLCFLVVSLVVLFDGSEGLGVMSIDLGSEWLKMALVKPGVPMAIVYNKESK